VNGPPEVRFRRYFKTISLLRHALRKQRCIYFTLSIHTYSHTHIYIYIFQIPIYWMVITSALQNGAGRSKIENRALRFPSSSRNFDLRKKRYDAIDPVDFRRRTTSRVSCRAAVFARSVTERRQTFLITSPVQYARRLPVLLARPVAVVVASPSPPTPFAGQTCRCICTESTRALNRRVESTDRL